LLERKTVEVHALVNQVIQANHSVAAGPRHFSKSRQCRGAWNPVYDPDRLTQVITNLLSNAIKFSAARRRGNHVD